MNEQMNDMNRKPIRCQLMPIVAGRDNEYHRHHRRARRRPARRRPNMAEEMGAISISMPSCHHRRAAMASSACARARGEKPSRAVRIARAVSRDKRIVITAKAGAYRGENKISSFAIAPLGGVACGRPMRAANSYIDQYRHAVYCAPAGLRRRLHRRPLINM